ncbi:YxiG family protein [Lunatimonas salinarum]|uniref:YxiG family protein n=1 Tax=Lunatimonas salinarum TaxID=1774590 RepID=UPI001ADEE0C9|nr:hypothetical protein [Lunatimonas salinarum]
MNVSQDVLNGLYGSEIKSIDFDFSRNTITIDLRTSEGGKSRDFKLVFNEVLKYKVNKDRADEEWEFISVAEIFHLPELGVEYSIEESEKANYNYLFDGDGFEIFIMAGSLNLQES